MKKKKKKLINRLILCSFALAIITILSACTFPYAIYPKKDYSKIITKQLDYNLSKPNLPKIDYNNKEVRHKLEDFNKVFEGLMSTYYKPFSYDEVKKFALEGLKNTDIITLPTAQIIDNVSFEILKHTDPYTRILSKHERDRARKRLRNKSKAFGFAFKKTDNGLEILAINKKSKLNVHDIQVGDIIISVNQTSFTHDNISTSAFPWEVLAHDSAEFTFLKKNGDKKVVKISKVYISNDSIDIAKLFNKENVDIFYIGISSFIRNTANDFKQRYKHLLTRNNNKQPFALIIDVRSNPGGLLSSVTQICDYFISSGIYYKLVNLKNEFDYTAYYDDLDDGSMKIAVLIDGDTASSSEILAGCLYYQRGALLIGEKTFGKSVAQVTIGLNDGRALKITSGQGFTDLDNLKFSPFIPDIKIADNKSTQEDEVLQTALNTLFSIAKSDIKPKSK